jgi:hypothetical protein
MVPQDVAAVKSVPFLGLPPLLLGEGLDLPRRQPALLAFPGLGRALLGLGMGGYRRGRHDHIVITPAVGRWHDALQLLDRLGSRLLSSKKSLSERAFWRLLW